MMKQKLTAMNYSIAFSKLLTSNSQKDYNVKPNQPNHPHEPPL